MSDLTTDITTCGYCGEEIYGTKPTTCVDCKKFEPATPKSHEGDAIIASEKYAANSDCVLEAISKVLNKSTSDDFLAGVKFQHEKSAARIAELTTALEKIAEAERMGYGTQRTYGEMAIAALQKSKGDE